MSLCIKYKFSFSLRIQDWEKLWEASRVPDSCCQNKAYGCGLNFETEKIYIDGCLTSQVEQSAKNLRIIGVAAIVGAIGEAAVILLSILIAWCEDSPNRDCTQPPSLFIVKPKA